MTHSILYALTLWATAATAATEFDVQPLEGQRLSGRLVAMDAAQVTLETASGRVSIATDKVAGIAAKSSPAAAGDAGAWIGLVDGSMLTARQYTAQEGRAKIELAGGETLEVSTREVAFVRLRNGSESMASEWTRILGMKPQSDLLVAAKGDAMDYHKGTIRDVTDKQVRFDFEGDVLAVQRTKVYGLVYYHAGESPSPGDTYTVVDAAGSRWAARSIHLAGQLEWTSPSGRTVRRDLDRIAQIDLSQGKIVYLSDLRADSATYTPFFGMSKELPARLDFFRPRQDQGQEARPLRLAGHAFAKGLSLHSRTETAYTLPGRFSRFEAVAGIDDDVRPRGHVRLVIRGDDRVLLDTAVSGAEPPKPVSLDLGGTRRLVILVDYGDDLDMGDHLDLGNARLIR